MRRLTISLLCVVFTLSVFAQDSNSPEALYNRAMDVLLSKSTAVSPLDAVDWLRRSADNGYMPAQTALGYLYETGQIVAGDQRAAADWYSKAAQQDDRLAQWSLGRLYGSIALPSAPDVRDKWLRQAADAGDPFGAYLLARVHKDDDLKLAAKYFRMAAEQGIPYAQFYLGVALRDGRGTAIDKREAYKWLLLSKQSGIADGNNGAQSLEPGFSTKELEQLRAEVRDLRDKTNRAVIAHGCTGWDGEFDLIPSPPPLAIQKYCR